MSQSYVTLDIAIHTADRLDVNLPDTAVGPYLELDESTPKRQRNQVATELLREHGEGLFAAFTDRFDHCARLLEGAAHSLRALPRLRVEPDGGPTETWHQARYGEAAIGRITSLWNLLVTSPAGFPGTGGGLKLLVIADVDPATFDELSPKKTGLNGPWPAVCAGLELNLATPTTFRQRSRALAQYRQDQEAEAAAASRAATRGNRRRSADPLSYVSDS